MGICVRALKDWPFRLVEHEYDERDTALYALCVGYGVDPTDRRALRYVHGPTLSVAPSMAAILAFPGQWMRDPESGIDWVHVVHGEQRVILHRPLPPSGKVVGRTRVTSVVDKGPGKGALVLMERTVTDAHSGVLLATVEQLNICRRDGGFSRPGNQGDPAPEAVRRIPPRPPDASCDLATRPETALLYRLCGDPNLLHVDPEVAQAAGFERPILHGLATYGFACHALLRTVCNYDAGGLGALHARFSAPVYPGETLRTEIWREGPALAFRTRAVERDVVVLDHGWATLG